MSDAMSNREIEDVLTSIRRLVAQDGPRVADSGRLILTEAQRVSVTLATADGGTDTGTTPTADLAAAAPQVPVPGAITAAPLPAPDLSLPEPDFGKLEATIAELEAAVSASGEVWEPEATADFTPRPSNVTDLYGRLNFVHRAAPEVPQAETDGTAAETDVVEAATNRPAPVDHDIAATASQDDSVSVAAKSEPEPTPAPTPVVADIADSVVATPLDQDAPQAAEPAQPPTADNDADNDAPLFDDEAEGDTILDEAALRAVIAQIVREELHGQLGERITQQVRKLVRAEIAKALDDRSYL